MSTTTVQPVHASRSVQCPTFRPATEVMEAELVIICILFRFRCVIPYGAGAETTFARRCTLIIVRCKLLKLITSGEG